MGLSSLRENKKKGTYVCPPGSRCCDAGMRVCDGSCMEIGQVSLDVPRCKSLYLNVIRVPYFVCVSGGSHGYVGGYSSKLKMQVLKGPGIP